MPSSIEKIVDGFLFPTSDPTIGTPDYKSIADIHLNLNSNAASVQSNLRCGILGLLFLQFRPPFMPLYIQLRLFRQLTQDPNQASVLAQLAPSFPTYGIATPNPPRSSPSTKTRTKPFVSFCWRLQTNCMSDLYVTNTSATGRRLLERS